jgi:hypothetical protein
MEDFSKHSAIWVVSDETKIGGEIQFVKQA